MREPLKRGASKQARNRRRASVYSSLLCNARNRRKSKQRAINYSFFFCCAPVWRLRASTVLALAKHATLGSSDPATYEYFVASEGLLSSRALSFKSALEFTRETATRCTGLLQMQLDLGAMRDRQGGTMTQNQTVWRTGFSNSKEQSRSW
jgi:hypothetical protein